MSSPILGLVYAGDFPTSEAAAPVQTPSFPCLLEGFVQVQLLQWLKSGQMHTVEKAFLCVWGKETIRLLSFEAVAAVHNIPLRRNWRAYGTVGNLLLQ